MSPAPLACRALRHRRISILSAVALLTACVLALAGCGPEGPTEAGGDAADPMAALAILPSPGDLRGDPAAPADVPAVQRAFTGEADDELTDRIAGRGMKDAAVRTWTGPGGQELVTVVTVWESHLIATGIGGSAAELLLKTPGARAWTPDVVNGSRGARVSTPEHEETRVAYAVGPNSIYVRSVGPVPEDVVPTALDRLVRYLRGQDG